MTKREIKDKADSFCRDISLLKKRDYYVAGFEDAMDELDAQLSEKNKEIERLKLTHSELEKLYRSENERLQRIINELTSPPTIERK